MRRHAKALSVGSAQRQASDLGGIVRGAFATRGVNGDADGSGGPAGGHARSRTGVRSSLATAALAALSLVALLSIVTPASAATVSTHPQLPFSPITGSGIGVTLHDPFGVAVDEANGNVFLNDGRVFGGSGGNVTDIFGAEGGVPSGVASPHQITGFQFGPNSTDVAVDNSASSPSRGAVYVADQGDDAVKKFVRNAGNELYEAAGQLTPSSGLSLQTPLGVAVDSHGNVFVADYGSQSVVEFSPTGAQLARIGTSTTTSNPGSVAVDDAGDLFVRGVNEGSVYEYPANGSGQVEEAVFTQVLAPGSGATGLAVDTATNTLYIALGDHVNQYDAATLALQSEFGNGTLGATSRIAVNATTGDVYVADTAQVDVVAFGPTVTGTVPDLTIETTAEKGVSRAKFSGKINPQSVPNSYFFEWKQGEGSSWAAAESSPPVSIEPSDSAEHSVSFNATGLNGNATYQVRLVGENTEKGLLAFSSPDTFETVEPALPAVTLAAPSPVGTTTAMVTGTVNPQEDFDTNWSLLISTDPSCTSGFVRKPLHSLESEADAPVAVSEEITGLLPSQHYCVQIEATNGAGSASSTEIREFTTEQALPNQVFTAFAAPRTDTTARLNARVNPQGASPAEPLTYRFEYSEDGGSTWIALPEQEYTGGAREQILLSEDLSGLEPSSSYQYRFSAEDQAGPASPQGATKSFTTRTSAEMQLPQRGDELVNNPDKGNQHIVFTEFESGDGSMITPDGNKLVWSVPGGAPGGTSGTYTAFLATRSSSGWHSKPLVPPAAAQIGGGTLKYLPVYASPDFTHFIFRTEEPGLPGFGSPPSNYVRLDDDQNQDFLAHFDVNTFSTPVDVSSDTAHVLHTGEDTNVLEDIGSGAPEVVGLMPNGLPPACGIHFGTEFAGVQGSEHAYPGYHWIATTDASRVYFQTRGENCGGLEGLYVRNRDEGVTTQIAQEASFIRATPDGHSAFFTTSEALSGDDTNSDRDVYEWTEGVGPTCLTCVVADAEVTSDVRVSDDFSHVYFQSTRQLLPGEGNQGDLNLYVLSDGTVRFVADPNEGNVMTGADSMQMSQDGNVMTFLSQSRLTTDQIAPSCTDPLEGTHPCRELYRYDDRDGSLECISCQHDGTTTEDIFTESIGKRFRMSRDGSTVAFTTAQPLLRSDINRGTDVYEWRNGVVGLITDGETEFAGLLAAPAVVGVDADGSNIFFTVAQPGLTGFEQDGVDNAYDARIGGGFELPPPAEHCSEESCQGPLQGAPSSQQPVSSAFSGAGNSALAPTKVRHSCVGKHGKAHQRCLHRHKKQVGKHKKQTGKHRANVRGAK